MRMIQTFWTAGQDPLKYAFGWTQPEHNLLSWALSCLSLRKHYNEVELYTDSAGYHILIEELKLPYTKAHVIFDDFDCLPRHWALSKIKTYALQTEPFLHVDGDLYVSKPFEKKILEAALVTQNREIGTGYYRHMMDGVLQLENLCLPEYIRKGLQEVSVASYNMGVFGGHDVTFIHKYCDKVFDFIRDNRINDAQCKNSWVNCNVFFEQVFFANFADHENREVEGLLDRKVRDDGYGTNEFCNLDFYGERPFFHLIGGHKRNKWVIDVFENAMIRCFPQYYRQIVRMFPQRFVRFSNDVEYRGASNRGTLCEEMAQWENFLDEQKKEWQDLSSEDLMETETLISNSHQFSLVSVQEQEKIKLKCNPHIAYFKIPEEWPEKTVDSLKLRFSCSEMYPLSMVAVTPSIRAEGLHYKPVLKMELMIIDVLKEQEMNFGELRQKIMVRCNFRTEPDIKCAKGHIRDSVSALLRNGILLMHSD